MAEGLDRIDTHGPASGQQTGEGDDDREEERYAEEGQQVVDLDAEDQAAHEFAQVGGADQPDRHAAGKEDRDPSEQQP